MKLSEVSCAIDLFSHQLSQLSDQRVAFDLPDTTRCGQIRPRTRSAYAYTYNMACGGRAELSTSFHVLESEWMATYHSH
jgi:hypothetical protein